MTKIEKSLAALILCIALVPNVPAQSETESPVSWEKFLRDSAVSREMLDIFADPDIPSWARFDPELGYTLGKYLPRDGIDGSLTISTSQADGTRTSRLYTDKPCRINAYGNSFTQCHQVSDGETWEEYLAAHLGEPIRNFGMGGYGVYQSYRRMIREESRLSSAQKGIEDEIGTEQIGTEEEKGEKGTELILFYIWGDDHLRSLWRCRHAAIYKWWDHRGGLMFHNNFWPNVELDLETGKLVEKENLLPTRESLYQMTSPDFMYESLKNDLALQMHAFSEGLINEVDLAGVSKLAVLLGQAPPSGSSAQSDLRKEVKIILDRYGFMVTKYILDKLRTYVRSENKKLLVILFDPYRAMREWIETGKRYDQEIVNYLEQNQFQYFDMNVVHADDFRQFNIPLEQYMKRYFIGHYSPAGNHFFAFSIKQRVVDLLDPKPITYQTGDQDQIDFRDYLPDW